MSQKVKFKMADDSHLGDLEALNDLEALDNYEISVHKLIENEVLHNILGLFYQNLKTAGFLIVTP